MELAGSAELWKFLRSALALLLSCVCVVTPVQVIVQLNTQVIVGEVTLSMSIPWMVCQHFQIHTDTNPAPSPSSCVGTRPESPAYLQADLFSTVAPAPHILQLIGKVV